jgi:RNA polymerase sigma factor (sigma-70 family)
MSAVFENTQWSLILRASETSPETAAQALEELCKRYWQPLFSYARRAFGLTHEDAQDLTQAFFQHLISSQLHSQARPERGTFRSYLITSLRNHWLRQRRDRMTLKRGGQAQHDSFDDADYSVSSSTIGPDAEFDRQWALTVLQVALDRLEQSHIQQGNGDRFAALKPVLTESYRGVAADLGLEEKVGLSSQSLRVAISRLRAEYRHSIRCEIAALVSDPSQVDEELKHLLTSLGSAA